MYCRVAHLSGAAIHIVNTQDPDNEGSKVLADYVEILALSPIVFYCVIYYLLLLRSTIRRVLNTRALASIDSRNNYVTSESSFVPQYSKHLFCFFHGHSAMTPACRHHCPPPSLPATLSSCAENPSEEILHPTSHSPPLPHVISSVPPDPLLRCTLPLCSFPGIQLIRVPLHHVHPSTA